MIASIGFPPPLLMNSSVLVAPHESSIFLNVLAKFPPKMRWTFYRFSKRLQIFIKILKNWKFFIYFWKIFWTLLQSERGSVPESLRRDPIISPPLVDYAQPENKFLRALLVKHTRTIKFLSSKWKILPKFAWFAWF